MKRDPVDFVAPLVAGSLVGLAAVLTLLPIALAIGDARPAASHSPDRPEMRDATTFSPPPPNVTPQSIVHPPSGDRKEIPT
jgi:hypothetical protein